MLPGLGDKKLLRLASVDLRTVGDVAHLTQQQLYTANQQLRGVNLFGLYHTCTALLAEHSCTSASPGQAAQDGALPDQQGSTPVFRADGDIDRDRDRSGARDEFRTPSRPSSLLPTAPTPAPKPPRTSFCSPPRAPLEALAHAIVSTASTSATTSPLQFDHEADHVHEPFQPAPSVQEVAHAGSPHAGRMLLQDTSEDEPQPDNQVQRDEGLFLYRHFCVMAILVSVMTWLSTFASAAVCIVGRARGRGSALAAVRTPVGSQWFSLRRPRRDGDGLEASPPGPQL